MENKIVLISNIKEIDRAEDMGIEPPEEEKAYRDVFFNVKDITFAYVTIDDEIIVKIDDEYLCIKYNDEIIRQLKNKFTNDNN